jgi:hypothetical protein
MNVRTYACTLSEIITSMVKAHYAIPALLAGNNSGVLLDYAQYT